MKAWFLSGRDYNFGMWAKDIPGSGVRDDSDDFITSVFHDIQEEGMQIEQPEKLTDEEATRLGILILELPQPPPIPRYAHTTCP
jgi:hypothetical protein